MCRLHTNHNFRTLPLLGPVLYAIVLYHRVQMGTVYTKSCAPIIHEVKGTETNIVKQEDSLPPLQSATLPLSEGPVAIRIGLDF